jgi:hypothetical protein
MEVGDVLEWAQHSDFWLELFGIDVELSEAINMLFFGWNRGYLRRSLV